MTKEHLEGEYMNDRWKSGMVLVAVAMLLGASTGNAGGAIPMDAKPELAFDAGRSGRVATVLGSLLQEIRDLAVSQEARRGSMNTEQAIRQLKVGAETETIVLELEGSAEITFRPSSDVLAVTELKIDGAKEGVLSLGIEDGRAVLRQKGEKVRARYTLSVPEGKKILLSGGVVDLRGELRAREFMVKAGVLELGARLVVRELIGLECGSGRISADVFDCGEIRLQCGPVSGRMTVPAITRLPQVPMWSGLRFVRRD